MFDSDVIEVAFKPRQPNRTVYGPGYDVYHPGFNFAERSTSYVLAGVPGHDFHGYLGVGFTVVCTLKIEPDVSRVSRLGGLLQYGRADFDRLTNLLKIWWDDWAYPSPHHVFFRRRR